ncbi:hypothetical protein CcNV_066 [Crangon crangon nudivirus]|uniref:Uncharacterized protein n=1 Tax=Crangon crangon nudivirus TaxID=2880838 RepID=A0AAE8XZY5_9VIRU|nr:hypothetical protein QKT25_gp067 [Crangon crangon nudivirus]UBZ25551.1 hypothetical protein CcNV_066 [Crangon crangon nudivirus]
MYILLIYILLIPYIAASTMPQHIYKSTATIYNNSEVNFSNILMGTMFLVLCYNISPIICVLSLIGLLAFLYVRQICSPLLLALNSLDFDTDDFTTTTRVRKDSSASSVDSEDVELTDEEEMADPVA